MEIAAKNSNLESSHLNAEHFSTLNLRFQTTLNNQDHNINTKRIKKSIEFDVILSNIFEEL
jgi:hypothetical protein